ncbi:Fatty acid desaturase 1, partial [Ophiophagus hannah]
MPPQSGPSAVKPETEPGVPRLFTWEEVSLRTGQGDFKEERWLVIDRKVYDISQFYLQHPGGFRIIRHYSGQDATDAFTALHKDKDLVKKYLNFLLIGELAPDQPCCEPTKNEMLVKDFHELRATVEKMGLFKSRFSFFAWIFLHSFILDIGSWCTIWYFGKSWMPFLLGVAMFTIGQIQYGFLQHDLGHVSVFEKLKWNKVAHFVVLGILKEMLVKDFHELRATVEKMGLFKSSFSFFAWIFLHSFILDIGSWFIIWYFGKSWMTFLLGVAMFTIGQAQYDFLQHDLGHLSVFEKLKWNKVAHFVVLCILKGQPTSLWNHLHNQHHAKPNCFLKDPDINMHPVVFTLGKKLSLKITIISLYKGPAPQNDEGLIEPPYVDLRREDIY